MKIPHSIWLSILIASLSIGFALVSLVFMQPGDCQRVCDEPEQAPCPSGSCRFGEQRAGFPLPVMIDSGAGSSPTSGWGKLGREDLPNPFTFLLDAAFYGILLAFAWRAGRILRGQEQSAALLGWLPLSIPALVILAAGLLSYHPISVKKSPASAPPETAILGNWRSKDAASGADFIFRFYESGRLSIVIPDGEQTYGPWGEYRWAGKDLRITFHGSSGPESGFCASLVSFLQGFCQTRVIDPASYPGPLEASNPAYPAPTVGPVAFGSVEETFHVTIAGDILTLTHPSSSAQTFRRVTRD